MRVCEVLEAERVWVAPAGAENAKAEVLGKLASLLSEALGLPNGDVLGPLLEREKLQSTGIGDGVAIPHAAVSGVQKQMASLVLSKQGFPFDAIDGEPVHIALAVIGPRQPSGEHLKLLARISRLLREKDNRKALLDAESPEAVMRLIEERDP